jgi:predicted ferric reductase/Ca2+-binding EF-hand superfamily protein
MAAPASASLIDRRLLESLERVFAIHAGTDDQIDVARLAAALGLRSDAIARRMFAIFDVDGNGAISRDEFITAVRKLLAGTTRDKLEFAFRLHDEDGDGTITLEELRQMVMIGLAEDNVAVGAAHVDVLARTYFARADSNGDGRISFDEFEALTARYPELLDRMTRTEARWIAPNEDLIARLEAREPARAASRIADRRRELVVLAIWIAANLALLVAAMAGGRKQSTLLDRFGDGCTSCILLDIGILVLLVMRRLLTKLRATRLGRILPIDHAITMHRIIGHSVFAFALGHGAARIVSFARQTRRPFVDELLSLEGLTGLVLVAMLAVMWWFARVAIRRSRRFELFYFTHLLYLPFLVIAVVHAPAILAWGGIAIAGLLVEHALRLRRRGREVELRSLTPLRSGVTRLELARPTGFEHGPADYVFLRLPDVARHEWHPFTISSAPEATSLVVHVRSLGNWTGALRRLAENPQARPLRAFLDGPYGSPSRHLFEARYAVMIGAGIGVTPFASILESIALGRAGRLEKAHFYWLNRDQFSFEWFAALLAELETDKHAERLDLHIHMTGGHAGLSAAGLEVARELLAERGHADLVTGLKGKTHMGHPDWDKELAAIQSRHAPEPVHVYFCGPEGLARKVAATCARLRMPFREEKF